MIYENELLQVCDDIDAHLGTGTPSELQQIRALNNITRAIIWHGEIIKGRDMGTTQDYD